MFTIDTFNLASPLGEKSGLVGLFDTAPTAMGEFGELEEVIGGTGRFAGATGTLHLFGQATNATISGHGSPPPFICEPAGRIPKRQALRSAALTA
jgi:hypothetical protein